jgi:hypothetical protein
MNNANLTGSMGYGSSNGCSLALIALMTEEQDTIIFPRQSLHNLPASIRAAIINHDYLHVVDQIAAQRQQPAQAGLDQMSLVVHGHQDTQ